MVKNRGGFTLLEVMITLAISGVMLVVAVTLFSGQQRRTQFAQSMRDFESTLQDVINDTATGYFPSSTLTCTSDASGTSVSGATSTEQGANQGCVFLGKAIHIKSSGVDIYPVVGGSALTATTFQETKPIVVSSLVQQKSYQWGLSVYDVIWASTPQSSHSADGRLLAIVTTPNGTGTNVDGTLNSGLQKIVTYSSAIAQSVGESSTTANINSVLQKAGLGWVDGDKVAICLEDASAGSAGRQYGGIIVSGGSNSVSARLMTDTDSLRCS